MVAGELVQEHARAEPTGAPAGGSGTGGKAQSGTEDRYAVLSGAGDEAASATGSRTKIVNLLAFSVSKAPRRRGISV